MTAHVDLRIHTEIKAAPATASNNWQTPVKTRPARIEPVPGVATFIMMHDHARSRLNGRSGEAGISDQWNWDLVPALLNAPTAQMPKGNPMTQQGVRHGTIARMAAVKANS